MAKSNTIAAVILGAAAGAALLKFFNMPKEDKDAFFAYLRNKTDDLLDDAETTVEKVEQYMNQIKLKGDDQLVDKLYIAKKMFTDLYGSEKNIFSN